MLTVRCHVQMQGGLPPWERTTCDAHPAKDSSEQHKDSDGASDYDIQDATDSNEVSYT